MQRRILLTAPSSGSGKTMITCGLLQALKNRGERPVSFKCGPDYIDPMFHAFVQDTPSANLDSFFTGPETLRYLLAQGARQGSISVLEGAMGYYDGLGGVSDRASAWDIARITETPAVLILDCRGMSLSAGAFLAGFSSFRSPSFIRGVILNRVSPMLAQRLKAVLEEETGLAVLGYIPEDPAFSVSSRHLGLVMPGEVEMLRAKIAHLADVMEQTVDIGRLLELADAAPGIREEMPPELREELESAKARRRGPAPVVAAAKDEAFCFWYRENLQLLEALGAEIVFFSPVHDAALPPCDGLLLPGGYPELYARELEANEGMRSSVTEAVRSGLPCMAECGGFMYLQQRLEDGDGVMRRMAGALEGECRMAGRSRRFGYITLTARRRQMLGDDIGDIRGHEYHYYESDRCGDAFEARKGAGDRRWTCVQGTERLIAGFPHLYYYSNPKVPARFLEACEAYRDQRTGS